MCDFISFVFSRVHGVHRLVTGFGAGGPARLHKQAAGQGFSRAGIIVHGRNVPIDLFLTCENRAGNADGQGFACDDVASWRASGTRNYNACPDLEDCFEADSALFLCPGSAVSGGFCPFGRSYGSNCGAADSAIFGVGPEATTVAADFLT